MYPFSHIRKQLYSALFDAVRSVYSQTMSLAIGIVGHEASPTLTANLIPELEKRGHRVKHLHLADLELHTFDSEAALKELLGFDVVYYRTSGLDPILPFELSRSLRARGRVCLNGIYDLHPHLPRKMYQAIRAGRAGRAGVCMPKTYAAAEPDFARISERLGTPFIAKLDISSQGRDVHKISTESEFQSLPAATSMNRYVFQEFIPHECDYRVHMLGERAAACYRRVPVPGDFRANVSRGGTMERVDETQKQTLFGLAEKLAPHFGLDICAIDFLHSTVNNDYYFAEVNLNPGWEYSDKDATGVDMSALTADYLEARAKEVQRI